MGMVAPKRERAQLDSNIVSGLAIDDVTREFVREIRRNGTEVMLSPAVVREIARTRRPTREHLVKAAMEYCDGFTNIPFQDMFEREIKAINRGELVAPIPTIPIRGLVRLLMEVAHSDKLLTRDKELFECGKLVRSVLSDTGPEIVLVPRPWPVF